MNRAIGRSQRSAWTKRKTVGWPLRSATAVEFLARLMAGGGEGGERCDRGADVWPGAKFVGPADAGGGSVPIRMSEANLRHRERLRVARSSNATGARLACPEAGREGRAIPDQPTEPSIWSWISLFISTAYSIGNSLTSGSMNPLTIRVLASASERPRLLR